MSKRYDYMEQVLRVLDAHIECESQATDLKRVLRKLVRDAAMLAPPTFSIPKTREVADQIAKELVP